MLASLQACVSTTPLRAQGDDASREDAGDAGDSRCNRMRQFEKTLQEHSSCDRDSDCVPTGLLNTRYQCVSVNGIWWASAEVDWSASVYACSPGYRMNPKCCALACISGRCRQQETWDTYLCVLGSDGGSFACPDGKVCRTESSGLLCQKELP